MSEQAVNSFIRYIKGDSKGKSAFNKPAVFYVTNDGQSAYWWYCPYAQCADNSVAEKKLVKMLMVKTVLDLQELDMLDGIME